MLNTTQTKKKPKTETPQTNKKPTKNPTSTQNHHHQKTPNHTEFSSAVVLFEPVVF